MIFGDIERFAFDASFHHGPSRVRICLWIFGDRVGDPTKECDLALLLEELRSVLADRRRESALFFRAEARDFVDTVRRGVTGYDASAEEEQRAIDEMWARFRLVIVAGGLEDIALFLVECSGRARLIVADAGGPPLSQYDLLAGEVDRVLVHAFEGFVAIEEYLKEVAEDVR